MMQTREKLLFLVSSVAEDYSKRFLEYRYDALGGSELFNGLKQVDIRKRLVLELTLYLLNALVKSRAKGDTPLSAYAKGVLSDTIPEICKRLINGDAAGGRVHGQGSSTAAEANPASCIDEASRRPESTGGQA